MNRKSFFVSPLGLFLALALSGLVQASSFSVTEEVNVLPNRLAFVERVAPGVILGGASTGRTVVLLVRRPDGEVGFLTNGTRFWKPPLPAGTSLLATNDKPAPIALSDRGLYFSTFVEGGSEIDTNWRVTEFGPEKIAYLGKEATYGATGTGRIKSLSPTFTNRSGFREFCVLDKRYVAENYGYMFRTLAETTPTVSDQLSVGDSLYFRDGGLLYEASLSTDGSRRPLPIQNIDEEIVNLSTVNFIIDPTTGKLFLIYGIMGGAEGATRIAEYVPGIQPRWRNILKIDGSNPSVVMGFSTSGEFQAALLQAGSQEALAIRDADGNWAVAIEKGVTLPDGHYVQEIASTFVAGEGEAYVEVDGSIYRIFRPTILDNDGNVSVDGLDSRLVYLPGRNLSVPDGETLVIADGGRVVRPTMVSPGQIAFRATDVGTGRHTLQVRVTSAGSSVTSGAINYQFTATIRRPVTTAGRQSRAN